MRPSLKPSPNPNEASDYDSSHLASPLPKERRLYLSGLLPTHPLTRVANVLSNQVTCRQVASLLRVLRNHL
jgi:hypothetical protein